MKGNTDILIEIASENMITYSQGNDDGYVEIEHLKTGYPDTVPFSVRVMDCS